MEVDRFLSTDDLWKPEVLYRLMDPSLLQELEDLEALGVSFSTPGGALHPGVTVRTLEPLGGRLGLDIHPRLGVPVGGWVAFQVNIRVPDQAHFGDVRGLTVPWAWVKVTLLALPSHIDWWLQVAIVGPTVAKITLLTSSILLGVLAVTRLVVIYRTVSYTLEQVSVQ